MSEIFNLPDVGEGLTEADILAWKVQPGAEVAVNDVLVEIETAKSVVELPSPFDGVVHELLAAEGETLEVGAPLLSVTTEGSPAEPAPAADGPEQSTPAQAVSSETGTAAGPAAEQAPAESSEEGGNAALVGSGPKADPVRRRARRRVEQPLTPRTPQEKAAQQPVPGQRPEPRAEGKRAPGLGANLVERARKLAEDGLRRLPSGAPEQSVGGEPTAHSRVPSEPPRRPTLAKPPVRKAAKELGIDLADVPGTGEQGQVTQKDLTNYAANTQDLSISPSDSFWYPQHTPGDRIERVPVKGVRKLTAKNMVKSATEAPHVSIFVDVDASRTMEFVKKLKASPSFEGVKVTPLLILAKAVVWATARNPQVNSSWTDQEILVKHFLNLGIAAATPRGLMVPNIKDAQDLSLRDLAIAIQRLTKNAREGKTSHEDMSHGTMTITNIGALGIDTGTPILNPGEAAIIAFGTIKQKPWVVDGEVIPRWITTLGGSFDHRVLDGDLSARFMADVAAVMEEPALLLDM